MPTSDLRTIDFDGESFSVDAALVASNFGLAPTLCRTLMRDGRITSRCERGVDEDAGRYRLTFFYGAQRLRIVVDEAGEILERHLDDAQPPRSPLSPRGRRLLRR